MRQTNILALVLLVAFVATGCETVKGTAEGFSKDVSNTSSNVPKVWDKLQKADAWMQENMW